MVVHVPPLVSWLGKQHGMCTTTGFKVLIKQVAVYFLHLQLIGEDSEENYIL
jgi:hypothetical protein